MNTSIKTILAVAAMGAAAIAANAQTSTSVGQPATPKVVTVDLGRALAGYYRTAEESTKLQTFEQNANKEFENMVTEGRAMGQKFQDAQATLQSPIATDIAKQQAQADAQRLAQDLQAKQDQLNDYRQKAMQQLQQGAMQSRQ
jgi:Skp family chaperone for outer membrane proteins